MKHEKEPGLFLPAWIIQDRVTTPLEKLVLSVVANYSRLPLGCIISNRELAEQVGSTMGSVRTCLVGLRKKGLLKPNEMKFRQPFKGPRLVLAVSKSTMGGVSNTNGGVSKSITDRGSIVTNAEEETANAVLLFSEAWYSQIGALLAVRGFDARRAEKRTREVVEELRFSRRLETVSHWVPWMAKILRDEDKAAARDAAILKKQGRTPPPASQFSTTH